MKTSFIRIMVFLAAFLSAPLAYAADKGFTALAPIPGLTDTAITSSSGFAAFFDKLYIYLIGAAVILAIIMIIWGGLEYSTQDSISKKSDGKSKIYNAFFGLVLVLSPVLVFTIINPQILNLNVNFPKLETTWVKYTPTGALGPDPKRPTPEIEAGSTGCYQLAPKTRPPTYSATCYTTSTECISAKTAAQRANPGTVDGAACSQPY